MNTIAVAIAAIAALTLTFATVRSIVRENDLRKERKKAQQTKDLALSIDKLERALEVGAHSPAARALADAKRQEERAWGEIAGCDARNVEPQSSAPESPHAHAGRPANEDDTAQRTQEIHEKPASGPARSSSAASREAARISAKRELEWREESRKKEKQDLINQRRREALIETIEIKLVNQINDRYPNLWLQSSLSEQDRRKARSYINSQESRKNESLRRNKAELSRYRAALEHAQSFGDNDCGQADYYARRIETLRESIDHTEVELHAIISVKRELQRA